ncbi:hypothetical protein NKJ26_06785 [Mesorhizobium sp. M0152]|uniref:hypothetical protein n=1 Tax=unclassified Mesorhizobium TaxID=325217 RepID=UPI00333D984E
MFLVAIKDPRFSSGCNNYRTGKEDASHSLGRRSAAAQAPRQDRICIIMTQTAFLNPPHAVMSTQAGDPATGFGAGWMGVAAILVMLVATIAASWVTWRFIEMPAMAWFRRLSKRI